MADVTRNDIIVEVLEKLEPIQKRDDEKRKRVFENLAVITTVSIILLSILLFEFNSGYCKVYNLPAECMSIDMKMLIPFAAQICTAMVVILLYVSSLKADKALGKNHFSLTRIAWGEFIVIYFIQKNQIVSIIGSWGGLLVSYAIPFLLEALLYIRKMPRKNKVVPEQEHDYVLMNTLRDAIFSTYYMKYGIVFFILPFIFSSYVGSITAYANRNYRTFSYDDSQYVVIVEYSDEVLAQPAQINNDELLIDTHEYRYFSKEGLVFSYYKYDSVIIGDKQELTKSTHGVPMEITDDTLPVGSSAFGQTEENTVPSENSEQETE